MTTTLKPRTTTVLIFQGDDLDPISEHAADVERTVTSAANLRLGDDPEVTASAKAFDDLMDAANERAVKVPLAALGRRAYRKLFNDHPPRMVPNDEGVLMPHVEDAQRGFNRETFGDDLIPVSIHLGRLGDDSDERAGIIRSVTEGTYSPPADIVDFVDDLADGDYSRVYVAAVNLNQSPGAAASPKVRLSSHLDQMSDETSESPARLA